MLSRVDERIGFKTPQQPIYLGANTDKAQKSVLNDDLELVIQETLHVQSLFLVGGKL